VPDPYQAGSGTGDPNDPGSWNRYVYVGGDPINGNDPKGLDTCKLNGEEEYQPACLTLLAPGPYRSTTPVHTVAEYDADHPKPLSLKQILSQAEKLATKWLANSDCNKLFNVSGEDPDPAQVMKSLASSGSYSSGTSEVRLFSINIGPIGLDGVTYPNLSVTSPGNLQTSTLTLVISRFTTMEAPGRSRMPPSRFFTSLVMRTTLRAGLVDRGSCQTASRRLALLTRSDRHS
jgi:hypothetical protein